MYRLLLYLSVISSLLKAQTITPGIHTGSPYSVDCTTSASGTLTFTSSGTFNAGNLFKVEISDGTGAYTTYPLFIGTLSLSGVNPSGTINLGIYAGLASGVSYDIRIVSTNPVVTSASVGAFSITNSGGVCSNGKLIVNEMSQGPSAATQEYVELLVLGATPCSVVDIRNMIIDDNNGDFISGGPASGYGIAAGHNRFDNSNQWSRVPSGSLILLYDNLNKNPSILLADDVNDANNDMVFVIPIKGASTASTGIEGTSNLPIATNGAYSPVTYNNASWSYMSLANSVDAIQTRFANGNFMHGFSWGGGSMIAGPGFIMGTTTTAGVVIYQNHTSGYTSSANYVRGAVPTFETPGMNNTVNNMTFITANTCVVLDEEGIFLEGISEESLAHLFWKKIEDSREGSYFTVQTSDNAVDFHSDELLYLNCDENGYYHHYLIKNDIPMYFRVLEEQSNGRLISSNILFLNRTTDKLIYFHSNTLFVGSHKEDLLLEILKTDGSLCYKQNIAKDIQEIPIQNMASGLYLAKISSATQNVIIRFIFSE